MDGTQSGNGPGIGRLSPAERKELETLIACARSEDGRDVTSEALVPADRRGEAVILVREDCRLAGLPAAEATAETFGVTFEPVRVEGTDCPAGSEVGRLRGPLRGILGCERILLNFLGRLSGIATLTRRYVEAFRPVPVYDTRKTTPGWRRLEKYAVRVGGGRNHRSGLYDQILIKDNHFAARRAAGLGEGVGEAVEAARRFLASQKAPEGAGRILIEVEVETEESFLEAVRAEPDIIMLDNWDPPAVRTALEQLEKSGARGGITIEFSGGLTLRNAGAVASLGVDRISVGALTHSAPGIDFSLEIVARAV